VSGLSFTFARELFEAYLLEAGYRKATIKGKLAYLGILYAYLGAEGMDDLRAVRRENMVAFAYYLGERKGRKTGRPLAENTKRSVLGVARLFFRCLCERGLLLVNPMRGIALAESGPERIRVHLSEGEVARFLDGIDTDAPFGLRDRALFELIYSSALRAGEASGLCVGDVDLERRLIRVRMSKYSKDRIVPMTELAAEKVADLVHARSADMPVFRGSQGKRVSGATINHHFKTLMKRAGLYHEGLSVHALRHACATHLLAHGADIRYVQGLLGHRSVQTTVRYTNELVENLRRRYLRGHPRENESWRAVDEAYKQGFEGFMGRLRQAKRKREVRAAKKLD
jgi:integrase/recombinase XerD